jgi:galactose mutarotase-like enzyme
VPPSHRIEETIRDGFGAVVLASPQLGATFVPELNMVGCSLRHEGEELLGQRGGLRRYAEAGSSMGIPLLHPWANRMDAPLRGHDVKRDANGLPMHGLLTAHPGWRITGSAADAGFASLLARFGFVDEGLLAAFPYPHELRLEIRLSEATLSVATTLTATAEKAVPVAFGWHPYLRLPGLPRGDWQVELPVRERALLDARGIPTGEREPFARAPGPLGDEEYDDLFTGVGGAFVLQGAGRRISIAFDEGYPWAQVYAPVGEDFICFEPMTAPTNALVSGDGLTHVAPGESFSARFSISLAA